MHDGRAKVAAEVRAWSERPGDNGACALSQRACYIRPPAKNDPPAAAVSMDDYGHL